MTQQIGLGQGLRLSSDERQRCQAIAGFQDGLVSQRAVALIALADGRTRLQAAQQSDLTIGQVRYLLYIFKRKGLALFGKAADPTAAGGIEQNQPSSEQAVAGPGGEAKSVKKEKKASKPSPDQGKKKDTGKKRSKKAQKEKEGKDKKREKGKEKAKKKNKDKAKKKK